MRFDYYSRGDTPDTPDADMTFQGINMTLDRGILPPGMLAMGRNTRTRTGHVKQRNGTTMPPDFNPDAGVGPPLCGSAVITDPNSNERLLVAPSELRYTVALADGRDAFKINYDATAIGDNTLLRAEMVQAFEKVILLRSSPSFTDFLVWNGTGDTDGDGVAQTNWMPAVISPEGLTLVPPTAQGEPFMDRIIYYWANTPLIANRDTWFLSDVLDYTSYDPVFQQFRTNAGEADMISRIMAYFKGSVIIFKTRSIYMATLGATYPVSITQRILNSKMGSIGNKMPLMVGGDIMFLSQPNGFYRLSEVIQEQVVTLPVPISEPIQAVIDNIDWNATAKWGCSAALDNYAFFAVCLKAGLPGPDRLNAILVYDTQRRQWESAGDTWADRTFGFNALHVTTYNDVHRLFAVDYETGSVYLLYEGVTDDLTEGSFSVPFRMETRGFNAGDTLAFKRFGRVSIGIKTSNPSMSVTAITDGFNEQKLLTPVPITKDKTKFYPHGHKTFDLETDDPLEPKREDYSVINDDNFLGEDYEEMPIGPVKAVQPSHTDVSTFDLQESLERLLVRSFGSWCSFRITNTTGVVEVSSVGVESTRAVNTGRTAA